MIGEVREWKEIKGYEGLYEVSNYGQVRSLDKVDCLGRERKGRVLKQQKHKRGYLNIGLTKNKIRKMCYVHRLVAQAFVLNPENKAEVNHIDGDKENNLAENLEWVTSSENNQHAYNTGLNQALNRAKGEKHGESKLTEKQVVEIYVRVHNGESGRKLASEFNVTHYTISDIKRGKRWSWLTNMIAI